MMRPTSRFFPGLLLAAALLFAQQGVALHALDHAMHDAAVATHGENHVPPLDHGKSECVAYGAVCHAIGGWTAALVAPVKQSFAVTPGPSGIAVLTRVAFDSRAPPLSA
jgi:hypothetical protein